MMAVVHWDGGSDGWGTNFLDAVNWVGDVLPGPADTAVIDATGTTAAITLSGTATVAEIDSSRPLRLEGGTLEGARFEASGAAQLVATSSGGTLSGVTLASDLDVSSGSITVRNGLSLDGATVRIGDRSGNSTGYVTFDGGTQAIAGSGEIIFGASPSNTLMARGAYNPGATPTETFTIGAGITIHGNAGRINDWWTSSSYPIRILNQGTIAADAVTPYAADLGYEQSGSTGWNGVVNHAIDTSAITDPLPEDAYRTNRSYPWYYNASDYRFDGLTAGASYRVRFHFADDVTAAGQRAINLALNGSTVQTGLDIYAEAGAPYKALVKEFTTSATDAGRIVANISASTGSWIISAIEVFQGSTRVASVDCGAPGLGGITIEPAVLVNEGSLAASNGDALTVAGTWNNTGSITASGATLNLGGSFSTAGLGALDGSRGAVNLTGTLDNTAATLKLNDTTGTLRIASGGTVSGGRIEATGTGKLLAAGGTLSGVTLASDLDVSSGSITVRNGLTLDGATVRIGDRSGSTSGTVTFDGGTQTLAGSGEIIFGASPSNTLMARGTYNPGATPTETFTIGAGITIHGNAGRINDSWTNSYYPIRILNQGTIAADAATPYAADLGYDQPAAGYYTSSFGNTVDRSAVTDPLPEGEYKNFRYDYASLNYTFNGLTAGAGYRVRLHFVEHASSSSGQRLMDVAFNGSTVQTGLDIYAESGARYKALAKDFTVTADSAGKIFASLVAKQDYALLSAIEIFQGSTRVASSDAGGAATGTITIEPAVLVNEGLIAASGATLNLGGSFSTAGLGALDGSRGTVNLTGTLDNTAATLKLNDTTGTLRIASGGTVSGGRIEATGTGKLLAAGGTLSGVTLASDLDVSSGSITVRNGLTLDGATVRIGDRSGNSTGYVTFDGGTQAIAGSGEIIFGASPSNTLMARGTYNPGATPTETFTIGAGITIHGNAGRINDSWTNFYYPIRILNQGTIAADAATPYAADLGYDQPAASYYTSSFGETVDRSAVTDPLPEGAYKTFRYDYASLNYTFDGLTARADYRVRLHFVEHAYSSSGQRLMDVAFNGTTVQAGLDIYAESGARYKALAKDFTVTADGAGKILASLIAKQNYALLSAIEVFQGSTRVASSDAGGAATGTITIEPAAFVNEGLIAASGATLNLSGSFSTAGLGALDGSRGTVNLTGTLDNTAATLKLNDTTGTLRIASGGTVSGGRIEATGTGKLLAAGGTLSGVTLASDLDVSSGSITVRNGLTLDGATVRIGDRDGNSTGYVTFDGGTQAIAGSGEIIFGASPSNTLMARGAYNPGATPTETFTIGAGITIHGNAGRINDSWTNFYYPIRILNQGTIAADAATPYAADLGYDQSAAGYYASSFGETVDRSAVTDPLPEGAYKTFRYDYASLNYTFDGLTAGADYRVRLHFVEHSYSSSGQRLMDVAFNGSTVQAGLDIYAESGASYKALAKDFTVTADGAGKILASLIAKQNYALLSAIEVFQGSTRVASSDAGGAATGTITIEPAAFENRATLAAAHGETLSISLTLSDTTWSNDGTITIDGATFNATRFGGNSGSITIARGTLNVTGDFIQTAGSTTLAEGTLDPTGVAVIAAGMLIGTGTVKADLSNAGTIVVGGAGTAGRLVVEATFTQATTGTLRLEIGGIRPAFSDSITPAISTETEPNDNGQPTFQPADLAAANDLSGSFVQAGDDVFQAAVTGTISSGSDGDWDFYKVPLFAGDILRIEMQGSAFDGGSLRDTYLHLYDAAGTRVAYDDDALGGNSSLITYTIPVSGDYFIAADSYGGGTGTYTLRTTVTRVAGGLLPNDLLRVVGTATLAGVLDVATIGSYRPTSSGLGYDVVRAASVSGTFATTDGLTLDGAHSLTVEYGPGKVTLRSEVDVNQVPTDILLSAASIAENAAIGTAVGTLSTADPDAGDSFTYALVAGAGDTDNASFEIVGATLQAKASFDYETKSSYTIRVRSSDAGGLTTEKTFTISVTNVNEAPTNILLSAASIAENAAIGTAVGTLSTADPDAGDTFTYALVAGASDTDNASFEIVGATLQAKASFDYETKSSYTIRVRSTDAGGLTTDKSFTISVTNINEAPTNILLSASSIAENAAVGTAVGTLSTADPDAGDTFTYALVAGASDTDNASFEIVGATLQAKASFDYETKSSYTIRVRSTDAGGLTTEKTFAINVTNVNEAPTNILLSATSIAENAEIGTALGTLSTADPDAGDTFTYALVAGASDTDNASFEIVGATLQAKASFDYETKSSYTIRVRSTDAGGLTIDKTFTISVTDVDESVPVDRRPTLDATKSPAFDILGVGTPTAGSTTGSILVSGLVDAGGALSNFSSASGGLPGVALTGVNLSGGRLWLSTDAGASWKEVGPVTDTFATLLAADAATRLFFAPAAGFSGTITDVITFRAWDRSGGFTNGFTGVNTQIDSPFVGGFDTSGYAQSVTLSADGRYAYVADYGAGLQILDISNPASPTRVGGYDTTGYASGVTLSTDGRYAFVADGADGLQILDISTPANPSLTATYDTSGFVKSVLLSANGRYAFLADDGGMGFQVVDISTPSRPTYAGGYNTIGRRASDLTLSADGGYLFLATLDGGIEILTVSNPARPAKVGGYDTNGTARGIGLSPNGRYAFVADNEAGLQILDVANPSSPIRVGGFDTGGAAISVRLSADGRYAYVADYSAGLQVLDVSNPSSPVRVGAFDTGSAVGVTLSADGRLAFVANGSAGLQILDATIGRQPFSLASDTASATPPSNAAPTNILLSAASVAENSAVGSAVGTLSTVDPDAGDTFTYALVAGAGDTDKASFEIVGAKLTAKANFDYETKSSYTIRVRSTDASSLTTDKSFTISVTNVNEATVPSIALAHDTGSRNDDGITNDPALTIAGMVAGGTVEYSLAGGAWTSKYAPTAGSVRVRVRQTVGPDTSGPTPELSFTLDTTGPRVIGVTKSAIAGQPEAFDVTFDSTVDADTVSPSDFMLTPTAGTAIAPSSTTRISDTVFRVTFPAQSVPGYYRLSVGPDVTDVAGNRMDQNADGINGDATADVSTTDVKILPQTPTVSLLNDTGSSSSDRITKDGTLAVSGNPGGVTEYSIDGGHTWLRSHSPTEGSNTVMVRQVAVVEGDTDFVWDDGYFTGRGHVHGVDSGLGDGSLWATSGWFELTRTYDAANVPLGRYELVTTVGPAVTTYLVGSGPNSADWVNWRTFHVDNLIYPNNDAPGGLHTGGSGAGYLSWWGLLFKDPSKDLVIQVHGNIDAHSSFFAKWCVSEYDAGSWFNWNVANGVTVQQTPGFASDPTTITFTLDTTVATPLISLEHDTGASATDGTTSDGTLALGSIESGATVEYSIDGGANWKTSLAAVESMNSVQVRQTDLAGNVSKVATLDFTLDTVSPAGIVVASVDTTTGIPSVTGVEGASTIEYSIDGGAHWAPSYTPHARLNDVLVRQTDLAGNASPTTAFSFTHTGAVAWDGGTDGQGTDLLDPVNWVGDVLPGSTEWAVIGGPGPRIVLSADTDVMPVSEIRTARDLVLSHGNLRGTRLVGQNGARFVVSAAGGTAMEATFAIDVDMESETGQLDLVGNTLLEGATVRVGNRAGTTRGAIHTFSASGPDWSLGGTGTVIFGARSGSYLFPVGVAGDVFTIGSGITIRGLNGDIYGETYSPVTIVNRGAILADAATPNATDLGYDTNPLGSVALRTETIDTSGISNNPLSQEAYRSIRYDASMTYVLESLVPGSTYRIRLSFMDDWADAGLREMTISVNGQPVLTGFDVTKSAGGIFRAIDRTFDAAADGTGAVTVHLAATKGGLCTIAAIEAFPADTTDYLPASRVASIDVGDAQSGQITLAPAGLVNEGRIGASHGSSVSLWTYPDFPWTNSATGTIAAARGTISLTGWNWTNAGTISADLGGSLWLSGTDWHNAGVIRATYDATVTIGGDGWANTGTISALDATIALTDDFTTAALGSIRHEATRDDFADFSIPGWVDPTGGIRIQGTLDNTGAVLRIGSGAALPEEWELAGGTIVGGRIESGGNSYLNVSNGQGGGALEGVTLATDMAIFSETVTIRGGLTLDGAAIRVGTQLGEQGLYLPGELRFEGGTQSIDGTGEIIFGGYSQNIRISGSGAEGETLTVGPGITIHGNSGTISGLSSAPIELVNQGRIAADGALSFETGFQADTAVGGTASYGLPIWDLSAVSDPLPAYVYTTARYGGVGSSTPFSYKLDGLVPGVTYRVRLHFGETNTNAVVGTRRFHVDVNGERKLADFDIVAAAGMPGKVILRDFDIAADANGSINLGFVAIRGNAMINALELFSGSTRLRAIDCGAPRPGTITVAPTAFVNHGTLAVSSGETLAVNPTAASWTNLGTLDVGQGTLNGNLGANAGTVRIGTGGKLAPSGDYDQSVGTTTLAGGTLAPAGAVRLSGGVLGGDGTIAANVTSAGTILPGGAGSIGTLTINGDLTLAAGGSLEIDVDGPSADRIAVQGHVNRGGTLVVKAGSSIPPTSGIRFDLLGHQSASGSFDAVSGTTLPNHRSFTVDQTGLLTSLVSKVDLPALSVALKYDTGSSALDRITRDGTLALSGLESGLTVEYSTDSGVTWVRTFAPVEGKNAVALRHIDTSGNVSPQTKLDFLLDTTRPTITVRSDRAELWRGQTAAISFAASETIEGFTAGDVATSGGILSGFNGSDWSFAATFTPAALSVANGVVTVSDGAFTDVAGNPSAGGSATIQVDTVAVDVLGSPLALGFARDGSFVGPSIGARWNGIEFLRQGAYVAGFSLAVDGQVLVNAWANGRSMAFPVTLQVAEAAGTHTVRIEGFPRAGLRFIRTVAWSDGQDHAIVATTLVNESASSFSGLALLDNQDVDPAGIFTTSNDVLRGGRLVVSSTDSGAMGLAATDPRAVVSAEGFFVTDPAAVLGSPEDPNGAGDDIAINVAFDIGSLAPGASTTCTYAMVFGTTPSAVDTVYDRVAPSLAPSVAIKSSRTSLGIGETATLTFTLSKPSVDFSAADVAVSGGTLTGFAGSGITYSATFVPTSDFEGIASVRVDASRFTDSSGNPNVAATLDPSIAVNTRALVAPVIRLTRDTGSSTPDGNTSDARLSITGVASGATLEYSLGGGAWTGTYAPADGEVRARVRQRIGAAVSPASTELVFTLDTVADAPVVTLVSDSGISTSDWTTADGRVNVALAERGYTVEVRKAGTTNWSTLATGTSPGGAAVTLANLQPALLQGANNLVFRVTDLAGNVSPNTLLGFTYDTVAPIVPVPRLWTDTGSSATDRVTSDAQLVYSSVEPGAKLEYRIGSGAWTTTFTAVQNARNVFSIRQTDRAGNTSPMGTFDFTWLPMAMTPNSRLLSDSGTLATDNLTNVGLVTVSRNGSALVQYSLDDGVTWTTTDGLPAADVGWVTVGDGGNPADPADIYSNRGSVAQAYRIQKFEFTNSQYVSFLNAVDPQGTNPTLPARAADDPIYDPLMGSTGQGGIAFTVGAAVGSKYAVRPNMGDKPVVYVSWFDAARVANWLQAGARSYATSAAGQTAILNGAYTLTATEYASYTYPGRNPGATFYIPTASEWYKAALYKGGSTAAGYWKWATQSDVDPVAVQATASGVGRLGASGMSPVTSGNSANLANQASWNGVTGNVTTVGSNGGQSAYGTYDMLGNVAEWQDLTGVTGNKSFYGSSYDWAPWGFLFPQTSYQAPSMTLAETSAATLGFRLASTVVVTDPLAVAPLTIPVGAVDGLNTVTIRQIDLAGNVSGTAVMGFNLDTTKPATPQVKLVSDTGPGANPAGTYLTDGITSNGTLTNVVPFETGARVEYRQAYPSLKPWSTSFTASQGYNSVEIRQIDQAGNISEIAFVRFTLDTTAPTITGISLPTAGDYRVGQTLSFSVTFTESVLVSPYTGPANLSANMTPYLELTIGGRKRRASYQSGSGTNTLVFSYTIETGYKETGANGIGIASLLSLNAGNWIADAAGNNSSLSFASKLPTTLPRIRIP